MRHLLKLMLDGAPPSPREALLHFEDKLTDDALDYASLDEKVAAYEFLLAFINKNSIPLLEYYDIDAQQLSGWMNAINYGEEKYKLYVLMSQIRANKNNIMSGSIESDVARALEEYDGLIKAHRPVGEFGYARLTGEEKEELRGHLDHIRGIIDRSDIPSQKKNALFVRIANLQKEIDKEGTKTDEFFAFMGDLSMCVGQMAKNAQPATDELKAILRIVMRSRAANEQAVLPSNSETAMLPFVRDEEESE
ncbi:MAG: hypothetical protein ACQRW7_06660 [Caulobacterales bacterium]|uniref:hypothetical protein n=1 Tax=Glycocaulis sp. TaxID=1969725 RepID=UPI003F9FB6EF